MTQEQRKRCFDPFYTTKKEGSGLGLSVCHSIILRHHGAISVEPVARGGTRFTVSLPSFSIHESSDNSETTPRGARVLLIDDNDIARRAMSILLQAYGLEVDEADNGDLGLQIAAGAEYSLVFLDFAMPGLSGPKLIQLLRHTLPDVPIVITSGWSEAIILEQFPDESSMPDLILEKPLSAQVVNDCLAQFDIQRTKRDNT